MNKIVIKDATITNIQPSHTVGHVDYDKATIIINDGTDNIITAKFKSVDNPYSENDKVSFCGQLRSHNVYSENSRSTELYISTDFVYPDNEELNNQLNLTGRICIKKELKVVDLRCYIKFILANNIFTADKKLNSYIPCIAYGKAALDIALLNIGDIILINKGRLKSKVYKDSNGNIKVSNQVSFVEFEVIDKDIDNVV